jgi:hypothetical protein
LIVETLDNEYFELTIGYLRIDYCSDDILECKLGEYCRCLKPSAVDFDLIDLEDDLENYTDDLPF